MRRQAINMQEHVAIVVGAGPSGLAVAASLYNLSIPHIILEREDCFASLWKKYAYDCLHLHLPKQYCELPLLPFPSNCPTYVTRDNFVNYLDEYVSQFKINPYYKRSVESAEYDEPTKMWKVKARNLSSDEIEEYAARFLVVATGESSNAFTPEVKGLNTYTGHAIHSTRYKNGKEYENRSVLVVGSGNSGMEIAYDLSRYGAKASLSIRGPFHVISRGIVYLGTVMAKYVSIGVLDSVAVMLSRLWFGDLSKYGIKRPGEGPFTMLWKYGKYPVVDAGTTAKIKSGEIQVLPPIASIQGNEVTFQDGRSYPFDTIIFATGFRRSTKKWLKGDEYLLNDDGIAKPAFPNNWKGKNGLYCAGLARRGLCGAGIDAKNIASDIKALL